MNPITKESIVLYQNQNFRVKSIFKNGTANLTSVFSNKIIHKSININDLTDDYDNWYAAWTKSEAYQSM